MMNESSAAHGPNPNRYLSGCCHNSTVRARPTGSPAQGAKPGAYHLGSSSAVFWGETLITVLTVMGSVGCLLGFVARLGKLKM